MSVVDGGGGSSGLVARVQNILLRPQEEFAKIDGEGASVQSLFMGYAVPLAAIPAVGGFVGQFLVTHNVMVGLAVAVLGYVLNLGGTFVFGLIVEALAPSFGATKDRIQAMKTVVYASTAAWVGGIFQIIPILGGVLALVAAVYSLYLLFVGLPKLMKAPEDRAVTYTIVAIVCDIVLYMVIAGIIGAVAASIIGGAMLAGAAAIR